jgi:hypothetical protein
MERDGNTQDGAIRDTPVLELVKAVRLRDSKHVSRDERRVDIGASFLQTFLCDSSEGRISSVRSR